MATPLPGDATLQPTQDSTSAPIIRTIHLSDLHQALRLGWEDFKAVPSHAIILCIIYPLLGLVLARAVFGYAVLPLLFPLAAGFALLGPFAALGLYELSRRRERGEEPSASDALEVLRSPSFGAMLGLGTLLLALFVTWVAAAQAIYLAVFGYEGASGVSDFVHRVLTTPQGWWLIVVGCGVGFLFALVALCISVVSFPMMLDRNASAGEAMVTSLRVAAKNPVTIAAWGLIVAALLVLVLGTTALGFARLLFPWKGMFVFSPGQAFSVLSAHDGLVRFIFSLLFMAVNASVMVSVAFMFSCFNMKPAAATILALSFLFVSMVMENIPFFDRYENFFITHHFKCWLLIFRDPAP